MFDESHLHDLNFEDYKPNLIREHLRPKFKGTIKQQTIFDFTSLNFFKAFKNLSLNKLLKVKNSIISI
jgi:hypothetical protein